MAIFRAFYPLFRRNTTFMAFIVAGGLMFDQVFNRGTRYIFFEVLNKGLHSLPVIACAVVCMPTFYPGRDKETKWQLDVNNGFNYLEPKLLALQAAAENDDDDE